MTSCKYKNDFGLITMLTCEFGCCEHDCCTHDEMIGNKEASVELGLFVGIPLSGVILIFILVMLIICYRHHERMKQRAALLKQLTEASRPRPTMIIHMESEVGQSRSQEGENGLPVAQGPPIYQEGTKAPASLEEGIDRSHASRLFGQGNSGYQRFENE
ncbi:uncharacterized protein LOC127870370 [Dreissena polymorpha]|uniref:Uncharacterized protein n=1 Tax=Dreissena polymorpha TaxID=45954 RepID=A0A9D4RKQ0_DREPO|nr:uncharacterized protein LOC127870370 [Dreissena polymorpha]KAH3869942.1 hypothetical protein DPMN_033120 [Dreissena polymorpha]